MSKIFLILLMVLGINTENVWAQCAMCRAVLENKLGSGEQGIETGINTGIMYLFMMPYLAIGTVIFFWYRASKANAVKKN